MSAAALRKVRAAGFLSITVASQIEIALSAMGAPNITIVMSQATTPIAWRGTAPEVPRSQQSSQVA
jgi:hypothetical protein